MVMLQLLPLLDVDEHKTGIGKQLTLASEQLLMRKPIFTCHLFPFDWSLLYSVSMQHHHYHHRHPCCHAVCNGCRLHSIFGIGITVYVRPNSNASPPKLQYFSCPYNCTVLYIIPDRELKHNIFNISNPIRC